MTQIDLDIKKQQIMFPITRFNWVDIIVIILLIRMGYIGFELGVSTELVKLAGLLVGFFVSFRYYQGLGDALSQVTSLPVEWAAALVMVALVFFLYIVVTKGLGLLEKLVQVSFHPKLKNVGGLLIGLVRAVLVVSILLVVCRQFRSPYMESSIEEHSLTGSFIVRMAPAVYDTTMPVINRLAGAFRFGAR